MKCFFNFFMIAGLSLAAISGSAASAQQESFDLWVGWAGRGALGLNLRSQNRSWLDHKAIPTAKARHNASYLKRQVESFSARSVTVRPDDLIGACEALDATTSKLHIYKVTTLGKLDLQSAQGMDAEECINQLYQMNP